MKSILHLMQFAYLKLVVSCGGNLFPPREREGRIAYELERDVKQANSEIGPLQ